jgi:putative addiction module component (TIGR02574 family)
MSTEELLRLPPEDRLALISALWDSLGDAAPISQSQQAELSRRLARFDTDAEKAQSWSDLKKDLAAKTG